MTFEEFWEQSGWHRPGEDPEIMGGAEYNLACDAWAAALASVEQAHTGPCSTGQFGSSILLKDGTKVKLNRGENAHNAHVWLSVEPQAQIRPAQAPNIGTAVKYAANALSSVMSELELTISDPVTQVVMLGDYDAKDRIEQAELVTMCERALESLSAMNGDTGIVELSVRQFALLLRAAMTGESCRAVDEMQIDYSDVEAQAHFQLPEGINWQPAAPPAAPEEAR